MLLVCCVGSRECCFTTVQFSMVKLQRNVLTSVFMRAVSNYNEVYRKVHEVQFAASNVWLGYLP